MEPNCILAMMGLSTSDLVTKIRTIRLQANTSDELVEWIRNRGICGRALVHMNVNHFRTFGLSHDAQQALQDMLTPFRYVFVLL